REHEPEILTSWLQHQRSALSTGSRLISEAEVGEQSRQFLALLISAIRNGNMDLMASEWTEVRDMLSELSRTRAQQGFTPSQTAMFIFSLKQPLFECLRQEFAGDAEAFAGETWNATMLLDKLGLLTAEAYQKGREEVISRQQHEMLELSTPVVKLWEGILALPLIGTLDSQRTQIVMESLLERIVQTGSDIAIVDITGVPIVDTLVAQHLLKTVSAARLMGADCIISGIRPQIAQTIVHLGVELGNVVTKSSLADAFALALKRRGLSVQSRKDGS
ncbi:MAG TPA: STAS domain-containing protein, partial [Terriglobia bacterium]|nr:STAS domain-containing protein [Terriglobia bacterium]